MLKLRKTGIIAIAGIIISFVLTAVMPASADTLKLTLASTLAPNSNLELAAKQYADIIGEKTGGQIQITHYGGGSLYDAKDLIPAVAKNQVNMGILHVAMVGRRSGILEFVSSFGAMGCWTSFDHYYRFIDLPEVRALADAEFEKYFNAKLLGPLAYGTGLFARSGKAIKTVEDFKGLKIRSSGAAQAAMFKVLGAVGVELDSSEIYTALQRGTIEACTTGSSRVRRARLYEVAPYITINPTEPFMSFYLVINKDVWGKIPAKDQALFIEEARALEGWTRDFVANEYKEDLEAIGAKAKIIYDMSPEEKKKLVAVVRPAMVEFSKKLLGDKHQEIWGLFDKAE
ncbi:MAG: TRAP transporter substrate-binding protein [Deltaproteobacteria bacterium]|nr:TRAP transporter substrate-binding protein [Deltaproteobacteria bacterium]